MVSSPGAVSLMQCSASSSMLLLRSCKISDEHRCDSASSWGLGCVGALGDVPFGVAFSDLLVPG